MTNQPIPKPSRKGPPDMTDRANPSWLTQDYTAGQAILDGLDHRAHDLEGRWGPGRLRLLVDDDMRIRFDRQCRKLNHAIRDGDLDLLRHETRRMLVAWNTVERAAQAGGHQPLAPEVWEVVTEDGELIAITRTTAEAALVARNNRAMAVYSLAEIGRLLGHYSASLGLIKTTWPGATVTAVREPSLSARLTDDGEMPF